jgi:hypothetical protein
MMAASGFEARLQGGCASSDRYPVVQVAIHQTPKKSPRRAMATTRIRLDIFSPCRLLSSIVFGDISRHESGKIYPPYE